MMHASVDQETHQEPGNEVGPYAGPLMQRLGQYWTVDSSKMIWFLSCTKHMDGFPRNWVLLREVNIVKTLQLKSQCWLNLKATE